jgi:hypothetical protein
MNFALPTTSPGSRVNDYRVAERITVPAASGRPLDNTQLNQLIKSIGGLASSTSTYECGGPFCSGATTYSRAEKPSASERTGNTVTVSNVSQDFHFEAQQRGQQFFVQGVGGGNVRISRGEGDDATSVVIPYRSLSASVTRDGLEVQINGKPLSNYFSSPAPLF